MNVREYLRNSWFFKKYEIDKDMPLMENVWRYQWNHKSIIMIECGLLYYLLDWLL